MTQKVLFENREIEVVKDKKKGTIEITNLEYDDNSEENLKNLREKNIPIPKIKGFSVSFWGHNEGSGSPCKNEEEVKKQVEYLKKEHSGKYKLEIKDERIKENLDNDWNEIDKITKRCEKEDEPYYYAFVEYGCKIDLNGKEELVSISDTLQRRRDELGSSSGCGSWITFKDKKDIKEFKEELLNIRKSVCDKPYTKEKCVNEGGGSDMFLTDIKIENTIVSFSKKASEYLEKNGFSIKEFYKEFNSFKQRLVTKDDLRQSNTFKIMEKQVEKLKDECWAIKGYFEDCSFLPKYRKKDYYSDKLKKLGLDITDLNKLRDLYIQKAKQYKIFYKKVYFMRWGKETEEEYCYP